MPGFRVTVGALLGAGGLLIAMVCLPAAATAADISITYAGPDPSGNPYDFTVTADDGNGLAITSMSAQLTNATTAQVITVPMTAQSTPPPNLSAQTWVADPAISPSTLPAGTYTVTVNAADADENDTGLQAPGFSFTYTSTLTASAQPPTVTQGSQSVTFSGQLTGAAPGGTATPIAGAPVLLNGSPTQVTTDSNGDFSYQAAGVTPGTYTFSVAATATYSAASAPVTVGAEQAVTSMTVQASPANVTEGSESVTFTGTVQVTPANSPAASIGSGVPVSVSVGGGSATVVASTNASGNFSYTATDVTAAATYTFSVTSTSLYTAASAAASVGTFAAPSTMTVTAVPAYVTYGSQSVTFDGTVTATPQGGSALGLGSGVPVSLTVTTSQGSTNMGQVTTTDDANGDFSYTATGLTAGGTYTFSTGGTSLYTSASYAVPVALNPGMTAVSVTASPPDINLGSSTVTFSGTVSVTPFGGTSSTGVGSGVPVYLSIGGGTASQVATTDDANGDFTYKVSNVTQPADYVFSVQAANFYQAGSDSVPIGLDQVNTTIAVTPNPASVTEGSQSVTFSGTVTGVSPEGSDPVPVAIQGAPVDVSIGSGAPQQVAITDSNGQFTYTAADISQQTPYEFSVASTSMYTQATADVTVAAVQAPIRFRDIKVTPSPLSYGAHATLAGVVQYQYNATWTALPGAVVQLTEGRHNLGSVTTNSTGQFTDKLPTNYGVSWKATVAAGNLSQQASYSAEMTVYVPVTVKSFSAKLGTNDKVSVKGCITTSAPIGQGPQPFTNIEYSAAKGGPWHLFRTELVLDQTPRPASCRTAEDSYFSGSIQAKLANAWYRVDYPAAKSLGMYSFDAATGPAVHAWKYPTRLTHFSMSPTHVKSGKDTNLKAELEQFTKGAWRPWAGQKVVLEVSYPQDPGVYYRPQNGTRRTNSKGWVTVPVAATGNNYVIIMYLFYLGNGQHLASHTSGAKLTVGHPKSQATAATIWLLGPSPGDGNVVLPELYPRQLSLTPLLEG